MSGKKQNKYTVAGCVHQNVAACNIHLCIRIAVKSVFTGSAA